jgi:DNA polymerase I-like protein with 3'-5' exonuclease and polymerase domains
LDKILGVENFNVKSSPQMKSLLKILGCGDLQSADEKSLIKARFRHPLNARIIGLVLAIRAARTLNEKYLQIGVKAKEFHRLDGTGNRILYSLNPHGTDSGRLASKEHHFWTGLQIQNIPRGPAVKQTFVADPGFLMGEVDLAQAESRDTGYISGDETLIHNVEFSPDFHSANAASFFGVPFEEIYDAFYVNPDGTVGKTINKPLRQLAKPVNHGANYNMGAFVLIDTMGEANVLMAKQLLNLPRFWTLLQVAEYLLEAFHKTYPNIKGVFYTGVVAEILSTRMLTSTALHNVTSEEEYLQKWEAGERSWIRHCFGHPDTNKQNLNTYISHPPQSLNATTLNIAYMRTFFEIAMHLEHSSNFKLCAQIHDSILFQYREGHEYLCKMVAEIMEIPVTVRGYDKVIRTFTVPADAAIGGKYWSDIKG